MKKKITIAIMIIVLLFGGIGLYILKQHSFDMAQQAVEIQTPQGKLAGTFVLEYNTRSQMQHDGYAEADIEKTVAKGREVRKLLRENASYDEYLKLVGEKDAMSKERWAFVGKNFLSDVTDDLRLFRSPVLLLLGDKDINVDSKETEQVYRRIVPPELLTVTVFPDTEHRMMNTKTADSEFRALMISLFAPRQITVPEYLNEMETFLKGMVGVNLNEW